MSSKKLGIDSIIFAAIMGLAFLLSPILTLYFTWSDLFALSSDWLLIDNLIVGFTLLIVGLVLRVILKEKNYPGLIYFFLPSFLGCLFYFGIVISFFQPRIRYEVKKYYYMQSAFESTPANYWVQKGFYEDFLNGETGKKLREDEELLVRLTEGLKPDSGRSEIGKGFGLKEYIQQGLIVFISYRENGISSSEIFDKPEAIWLFYSLALAESNPDLLETINIPEEFSRKYISYRPQEKFPLGILDDFKMNHFYELVLKNLSNSSEIETELAIFILTQIPVDLDDSSFEEIINRWIFYKPFYEKELRYLTNLRNSIRHKFLKEATLDKPIQVNLGSTNASDFAIAKPFLTSTGFSVEQGNDINLSFTSGAEFLKEKKVNRTKPVQKTRTISRTVSNYGSPVKYRTETKTETYTDYVSDGYDIVPMYVYSFYFPDVLPKEKNLRLCGMLSDCYLNPDKETTLPIEAYSRGETWIYALPKNLVCKTGCDGR